MVRARPNMKYWNIYLNKEYSVEEPYKIHTSRWKTWLNQSKCISMEIPLSIYRIDDLIANLKF